MWGAGFLPPKYQGVRFSPGKDPVLFLSNPPGISAARRRAAKPPHRHAAYPITGHLPTCTPMPPYHDFLIFS